METSVMAESGEIFPAACRMQTVAEKTENKISKNSPECILVCKLQIHNNEDGSSTKNVPIKSKRFVRAECTASGRVTGPDF